MAKGAKKKLQSALISQQTRLKKNAEAKAAGQVNEQKDRVKKSTSTRRSTIPFMPTDRILLVGEGDFSFAHALVLHPPEALEHLPSSNVVATAYDTEAECYEKYPGASEHVAALREKGATVLFGVDAAKLDKHPFLTKGKRFDRIVWNFPHAGKGIADQDRNIRANQELLLGFLRSAPDVLTRGPVPQVVKPRKKKRAEEDEDADERMSGDETPPGADAGGARGTLLVTLRNVAPYTDWDLPRLAKNPPAPKANEKLVRYKQLRSFVFNRKDWRGYAHRMTKGDRAHGTGTTGQGGEDRTWEFCMRYEDEQ
ncbi:hypothetical protein PENSPDRAFT_583684 [Peniophora sp. CONT]|nr:hypothetical protein PENSPDRAFT_583684 [Peniophora sp. CONT]